ncbi:MAG: DUF2914 domain-containing protein [Oligoflexales bacterium]
MAFARLKSLYKRHEKYGVILFFLAGLLLDVVLLGRIDSLFDIVQHAVYLAVVGILLTFEVIDAQGNLRVIGFLQKPWQYREEAIHFLLGALLSAFTIFYFKSASLLNSFLFFAVIVFLLVANELPSFRKMGLSIRFVLFSVCLVSYFSYVVPTLWGGVGFFPFVTALVLSGAILYGIYKFLEKRLENKDSLIGEIAMPTQLVFIVFFVMYVFQLIPPVPLSIKKIGIYHNVTKTPAGHELAHEQPWWKIWRSGDQHFVARPGDKIYCYFSVFSPTGFEDQVQVRWMYDGADGWSRSDAIPVKIAGGRDDGFRGYTFKENYQEGEWQVRIETMDGREIGRLYFDVVKDPVGTIERKFFKTLH